MFGEISQTWLTGLLKLARGPYQTTTKKHIKQKQKKKSLGPILGVWVSGLEGDVLYFLVNEFPSGGLLAFCLAIHFRFVTFSLFGGRHAFCFDMVISH